jgi:uncharacterized protein YlxW (UPF0749 family)
MMLGDIGIIISLIVALTACILSVAAALQASRKASVVEGRHLQEVVALREKVAALQDHEKALNEMAGDIREIKADMKWLKKERS